MSRTTNTNRSPTTLPPIHKLFRTIDPPVHRQTSGNPSATSNAARSPPASAAEHSPPPASTNTPASAARCSGPTQHSDRIAEIRDNLIARISEAEREGWLGEIEGLKISLTGANDKLAQVDRRSNTTKPVDLPMPTFLPTPQ